MTRPVLALDDDAPICMVCVRALGLRGRRLAATFSTRRCEHCGELRACATVGDYDPPGTQPPHDGDPWICGRCADARGGTLVSGLPPCRAHCSVCGKPHPCHHVGEYGWPGITTSGENSRRHQGKPWAEPDDYSEMETLLGRRA